MKRSSRGIETRPRVKLKRPKLKDIKLFFGLTRFSKKDKKKIEGINPTDLDMPDDCFDSLKAKKTSGKNSQNCTVIRIFL